MTTPKFGMSAARMFALLKLLREASTVAELAAALGGCSLKTVRRDLVELRTFGFKLSFVCEAHGVKRWHVVAPVATLQRLARDGGRRKR